MNLPIQNRIVIVDFGSQVTLLIARRLREAGVFCEILPPESTLGACRVQPPAGLIISGGPDSVDRTSAMSLDPQILELGIPILGICYGQQWICKTLGGRIEAGKSGEFGKAILHKRSESTLLEPLWDGADSVGVWMSHGDHVVEPPAGFTCIAQSGGAPFAAIANEEHRIWGIQFHPEVTHTTRGDRLLSYFAREVCGMADDWTMEGFRPRAVREIRERVGNNRVVCALSGGVDSMVTAWLIHEAVGENLICVFVDNGLLRQGEAKEVVRLFRAQTKITLIHEDASDRFLDLLKDVSDPEQKRRIIGKAFVETFESVIERIGSIDFLAQGTLYPDVVESQAPAGGTSALIKSHHNVGGLPDRMRLKLVEPLRLLFKDEVRKLGRELSIPQPILERHPFPGPGLAIRIPGTVSKTKINILQQADAIYLEELHTNGLYDHIWQAFAVLLPVHSVGIKGDARSYEHACVLRAVTSVDGMTAEAFPFDPALIAKIGARIANEVTGINRVLLDVTSKPPGTIEWE